MEILAIGNMSRISNNGKFRIQSLKRLENNVDIVDYGEYSGLKLYEYKLKNKMFQKGLPVHLQDICGENKKIIQKVLEKRYDLIWIEKGLTVSGNTLRKIKEISPNTILVNCTSDNMVMRHNQSQNFLDCIPVYDYHITTKSYIINDLKKLGAKEIIYTRKSYEDTFHYPRCVTEEDRDRLGADVGFVGSWEKQRMESILYLSRNGIKVRVFGEGKWSECMGDNANLKVEAKGLYDMDYPKSIACFKINLGFLRKINYDQQTDRTMEIPACGGFMLAERTKEHLELFEEGKEAEYFSSNDELLRKCRYYLEHDEERELIARAGRRRCMESGYSNVETLKKIIEKIYWDGKR